jgi:hypothetical protein
MDEATQIFTLLSGSTFWEDETRGCSMNMPGGMIVGIDPKGSGWTWRITRPDGSNRVSPEAFPSVQEAKSELRRELERRREEIIDEGMGPASVS